MSFGVYIHWPFCRSKCPYCDFFSKVKSDVPQDMLIDKYVDDLAYYAAKTKRRKVSSLFFGGGTPSLLTPKNVERVIDAVDKFWGFGDNVEISLEANPNTNKPNLFEDLRKAGINRLSLGVQSLNDESLKFLGRTHSVEDALLAAEKVVRVFDNHSADMMYALPNQNKAMWQKELMQFCSLGFRHLSLYQLMIEEGTVFAKKGVQALNDDAAVALYTMTGEVLAEYGYKQYEVSNYAKNGFECRHNKLYWQGDDYVGVGQGAHGRISVDGQVWAVEHCRKMEALTKEERAEELVLMGLRLVEGINKKHFEDCCGLRFDDFVSKEKKQELEQSGLIQDTDTKVKVTKKGFVLLNKIIESLVCYSPISINNN